MHMAVEMRTSVVSIHIPDIQSMSDDELADLRRTEDGRWSAQTKRLMSRFGTELLDLNANWAETWTQWTCSCCQRTKVDIARPASNGVLLCRLEMHHDHLADYAGDLFDQRNQIVEGATEQNSKIANARGAAITLTSRFSPTLICADCNAAEGEAKRLLGGAVASFFSFCPSEISQFIRVAPNRKHEVDPRAAMATGRRSRRT